MNVTQHLAKSILSEPSSEKSRAEEEEERQTQRFKLIKYDL
jgi:hypothetical protein